MSEHDATPGPPIILLVEDNFDHAELVVRGLRKCPQGPVVKHVVDGMAAVDYLFRRGCFADPEASPRPQMILLDLRLPRLSGLEVLAQLKADEDLRTIPVVVLTTSGARSDVDAAYARHVNSYLVKPTGFRDFMSLMEELAGYWLVYNRPSLVPASA